MMRVQVKNVQVRKVPIYKWEKDPKGVHFQTDQVLEVKEVEREEVLFSGSEDAFDIWKRGHFMPPTATIKRWPKAQKVLPMSLCLK